ncbi:uncharacterized protein F5147DRAFT_748161 [Suillus discolor]|uniref:Uncharacterized protein n=1 Tax=Suillus discolor TaxID=1912936 RepID=A0A9P7EVU2_9AGAM|nr:uncharacterized protein F5147DRAFT_748161 [Suillus discolor]KAG2091017.1 hypothetical protein F5147DRAFT_748161 [Suillus discolor]
MKEWVSPVYAFFDPTPHITEVGGRCAHEFKCRAKGCKATIRRFLDKKDARSTGNMHKHVKSCWVEDTLNAADNAKDANEVRTKIVGGILKNGSIMASFECKGKGKPEYYIPSPSTISRDVRLEYDGKINFTTDAWSSPNHRAFVAFSVHLEHNGIPLSLPLNIIEVAKVRNLP